MTSAFMATNPLPMALTAYGMPHVMGYLAARDGTRHPDPLDPVGLMDAVRKLGLAGVEFPLSSRVPSFEGPLRRNARAGRRPAGSAPHARPSRGRRLRRPPGQRRRPFPRLPARGGVRRRHPWCGRR
jgi:hypothetical protein